MLILLFCGLPGACGPLTLPCTALGAAGGVVPHFADGDLTLQIDHVIAGENAEDVELELGYILLLGVQVDISIVFDAPDGKKKPQVKRINLKHAAVCCLVTQSCSTLFDPRHCSLPGSSVHAIFQVGILERVAISCSRGSS